MQPVCIVSPQTAQDVSTAVRILTTTNASTHFNAMDSAGGCQFAVRSGGHANFAGAANIAGGVTIDLSGLSGLTLSPLGLDVPPTLSVGVGSTWGSVYAYLDPFSLSVSGGRSAGTGVGGLTLGGGISYFGPRIGWSCDGVMNFEIVLANGTTVNANADENPDLLWALRGGTNNFGVVTRIDLQTFPQGDLWGGQVVRSFEAAEEQIIALAEFNDLRRYDEFASLITTFAYSGTQNVQVVVNDMEYTKAVADPPVFHALANMTALSSTERITDLSDLAAETEANNPHGFRCALSFPWPPPLFASLRMSHGDVIEWIMYACITIWNYLHNNTHAMLVLYGFMIYTFTHNQPQTAGNRQASATLTIVSSVAAINATVLAWNASLASIHAIPGIVWSVGMDPLPPQLYARHAGENALGLTNRKGRALIVVNLGMTWSNAADDDTVDKAARALVEAIQRAVGKLDALDPFVYVNYAAPWQQPIESYGEASAERLRSVQRVYDPRRVFTDVVPGGFKVPG